MRLRPRGALRRVGRGAPVTAPGGGGGGFGGGGGGGGRHTHNDQRVAGRREARVRAFTLKGVTKQCRQMFRCLTVRLCGECTGTLSLISAMSNYPVPFSQTAYVIWLKRCRFSRICLFVLAGRKGVILPNPRV